ncbi:BON domain-containing protein [Burkholderia sp. BCCIQ04A]|uniref:BON domain-containing protein n=1 Tax=Burkholderia anthinoferrum TaxID=3090833 RepID=A0ABU5WSH9_9BURK|nr:MULTISPECIES: BON domain-containing protein [Burkholderia]MEB2506493.1 BON domain-containing protein [Burkholderia anthinoferrum]MEB2531476.1 BON domain-containing protein [Burkholderia anthinoferrum]MEB2563368.1 BON domain-containing protein [Burkholderia anthinoferrum]MEB2581358.1 BON domain-containing protein [Burkholderia anthinoferrum]MDF3100859.1 BON domain-containing protein [Burkholderia semiarida]
MKSRFAIVVAGFVALSPLAGHAQSATAAAPAEQASSAPASPRAAKKAERAADRAFAKKVRQAIVRAPGVDHAQVTVFANAKTGDVTLAGQITDESQDRAAVDAARRVAGVTSVKSRLQLRLEGGQ